MSDISDWLARRSGRIVTIEFLMSVTDDEFSRAVAARDAREKRRRELESHEWRAANARADALLVSLLDSENRARYRTRESIVVTGSAGGMYRIDRGYSGNVYRLDGNGCIVGTYCAHPMLYEYPVGERTAIIIADAMVAQILTLLTDEPGFLRVACSM